MHQQLIPIVGQYLYPAVIAHAVMDKKNIGLHHYIVAERGLEGNQADHCYLDIHREKPGYCEPLKVLSK